MFRFRFLKKSTVPVRFRFSQSQKLRLRFGFGLHEKWPENRVFGFGSVNRSFPKPIVLVVETQQNDATLHIKDNLPLPMSIPGLILPTAPRVEERYTLVNY